jgi:deazaflavin-dependent oxidoreductase (nitroreductase family)
LPNIRWLIALVTKIHRGVYRVSGGRVGSGAFGMRFLLLRHLGRRTRRERITPLLYVSDADRWVVVASNGGDERDPAWWLNLKSHPAAQIQVGREHFRVAARAATDAECARLWPRLLAAYSSFELYRQRAKRPIPVVILERAG